MAVSVTGDLVAGGGQSAKQRGQIARGPAQDEESGPAAVRSQPLADALQKRLGPTRQARPLRNRNRPGKRLAVEVLLDIHAQAA